MSANDSSVEEVMVAESATEPLLVVEGLTTWFGTPRGVVHAVDDVSFELSAGQTLGIVGESGSGKSVLARTIMRLTPSHALTAGRVRFDGRDLRALSRHEGRRIWGKEISMVFQDPMTSLNPVIRVGRQITETLQVHLGLESDEAKTTAIQLLTLVGIPEARRRFRAYPYELSGGMRQRVCIAIALACSPRLLFADEPTTALDVTIQRQILDLLRDLQRTNGMAMVLVTHDLGVVAKRTDRVLVMYAGRVVETASTKVLFNEMRHPYTAALLASIPRIKQPSHTRLAVIGGRPVDVIDPQPGCRFAPRCTSSQPRCTREDPVLTPTGTPGHSFACFYPVGTPEGDEALRVNVEKGSNAVGLRVDPDTEVHH